MDILTKLDYPHRCIRAYSVYWESIHLLLWPGEDKTSRKELYMTKERSTYMTKERSMYMTSNLLLFASYSKLATCVLSSRAGLILDPMTHCNGAGSFTHLWLHFVSIRSFNYGIQWAVSTICNELLPYFTSSSHIDWQVDFIKTCLLS